MLELYRLDSVSEVTHFISKIPHQSCVCRNLQTPKKAKSPSCEKGKKFEKIPP